MKQGACGDTGHGDRITIPTSVAASIKGSYICIKDTLVNVEVCVGNKTIDTIDCMA